jgi:hypothetical protein
MQQRLGNIVVIDTTACPMYKPETNEKRIQHDGSKHLQGLRNEIAFSFILARVSNIRILRFLCAHTR